MHEIDLTKPSALEKGCVYIVPLLEELSLPPKISGKVNPKSTTGRLDIFARLITDYGTEFERIEAGYKGKLYVEIVPRTFSVLVHEGTKLNQMRLIRGEPPPSDAGLNKLDEKETLVYLRNDIPDEAMIDKGLWMSIDLQGSDDTEIIGYKAKGHAPLIDLEKIDYYDPLEFWEPIHRPKSKSIILNPDDFYILLSRQKFRIPPQCAAEMVAYDPSVGEFRIHYAGFFDPGFGYGHGDIKGTHAVLEVRSHEVPFLLEDGQVVGRLIYERLLAMPEKIYGAGIGSSYQDQGLSLSKQFKRS
jgi:dCTP deaminase